MRTIRISVFATVAVGCLGPQACGGVLVFKPHYERTSGPPGVPHPDVLVNLSFNLVDANTGRGILGISSGYAKC